MRAKKQCWLHGYARIFGLHPGVEMSAEVQDRFPNGLVR